MQHRASQADRIHFTEAITTTVKTTMVQVVCERLRELFMACQRADDDDDGGRGLPPSGPVQLSWLQFSLSCRRERNKLVRQCDLEFLPIVARRFV